MLESWDAAVRLSLSATLQPLYSPRTLEPPFMPGRQDAWKLGCCCLLLAVSNPPTLVSPSDP